MRATPRISPPGLRGLSISEALASRCRGFSLIELFLVLVVIGILVGLAIPHYYHYKRRFYLATMVTDLRNLAVAEEAYWNEAGAYSVDLQAMHYTNTPRVSITMVGADSSGWSARASYAGDAGTCAIFYGAAPVVSPATLKNVIGCTPPP